MYLVDPAWPGQTGEGRAVFGPPYFLLMPAGGPAWGPRGVWGLLRP